MWKLPGRSLRSCYHFFLPATSLWNKRLYMAFIDLEKAFDRVPRKVICRALRKLCVEEWIVPLVQGMYANAWSGVHVGNKGYSEEFEVKVGVHQCSLLFIIVLEALSPEFCSGVPWEDLYIDDLVIVAKSLEECVRRLLTWKEAMEEKGLRVNAGKTKIMIWSTGLDILQSSGEFPCTICRTGVSSNSMQWLQALGAQEMQWAQVLDKGPWLQMYMVPGNCHPLDGRPQREVCQTWQAGCGSFLLLPRRHALSSRWLWIFSHNTCENCLEEV